MIGDPFRSDCPEFQTAGRCGAQKSTPTQCGRASFEPEIDNGMPMTISLKFKNLILCSPPVETIRC